MNKLMYNVTHVGRFFDSLCAIIQIGHRHFEFFMNVLDKTHMYEQGDETTFRGRHGLQRIATISNELVLAEVSVSIWMEGEWKFVIRDMSINVAADISQEVLFDTIFPHLAEMVVQIVDGH